MRNEKVFKQVIFIGMAFSALSAAAQVTGDKMDKKLVGQQAKISEDSSKLVKFKGMIFQFEKDKKNAADQAQQSADDNKRAADRLSNDPQDKKLARKADGAASMARSDARKARVAADKLDDLNKDIEKLTKQLEKEHRKLDKYQEAARAAGPAGGGAPVGALPDSTNH
jgi:hypothetical protein